MGTLQFMRDFRHLNDRSQLFYFYTWSLNRWLALRFDMLSIGLLGAAGTLLLMHPSRTTAGFAGFVITIIQRGADEGEGKFSATAYHLT